VNKNYLVTDSIKKDEKLIKDKINVLEEVTNLVWENLNYTMNSRGNKLSLFYNRVIKAFVCSFKIFIKRRQISNIIFWQQFFGLIFVFYCRLFNVKKNFNVIVVTFIYKEKKGLIGKIYYKFIKYIVTSKYIDRIICFSTAECEYYSKIFNVDKEKFKFIHIGIEDSSAEYQNIEKSDSEKFLLAVGKSNRDYKFLIDSLNGSEYKVKILCNTLNEKHQDNIEIYNNIFGKEYLKLLKQCYAVIIPLKDENISSGQLVMLQAMMLEKPIIITKSNTISDYVKDDFNAIIIEKNQRELINAINRINEQEFYKEITKNGRKKFEEELTEKIMYENIAKEVLKMKEEK
jgi:glycosyltransferase involved in cell wall biosynthesis